MCWLCDGKHSFFSTCIHSVRHLAAAGVEMRWTKVPRTVTGISSARRSMASCVFVCQRLLDTQTESKRLLQMFRHRLQPGIGWDLELKSITHGACRALPLCPLEVRFHFTAYHQQSAAEAEEWDGPIRSCWTGWSVSEQYSLYCDFSLISVQPGGVRVYEVGAVSWIKSPMKSSKIYC